MITSWREAFGVAGALISAFTPAIIFFMGFTRPIDAAFYLSVSMLILMPILTLNALFVVPEFPTRERVQTKIPLKESIGLVFRNKVYLRYIIIFTFSAIGSTMTNTLSFFFVEHVLIAGSLYGFYLAPYFLSQILSIPLWFKLSAKIGKHRATMCAIGWYAFWACWIPLIAIAPAEWFEPFRVEHILAWLPQTWFDNLMAEFEGIETGKFLFFIIIMCLKGSSIGALAALPQSMAADIVDYDTRTSGQQRAGAYFAIGGIIGKTAAALGVQIATLLVVLGGFNQLADPENTTNTAGALLWLACVYSVVPALFKFVAMPFLWRWPLTEDVLADVQQEIYGQPEPPPEASPLASAEPAAEEKLIEDLDDGKVPG